MKKAERIAALKPHLEHAGRAWYHALDMACTDPNPQTLEAFEKADRLCDELARLSQHAESAVDG